MLSTGSDIIVRCGPGVIPVCLWVWRFVEPDLTGTLTEVFLIYGRSWRACCCNGYNALKEFGLEDGIMVEPNDHHHFNCPIEVRGISFPTLRHIIYAAYPGARAYWRLIRGDLM